MSNTRNGEFLRYSLHFLLFLLNLKLGKKPLSSMSPTMIFRARQNSTSRFEGGKDELILVVGGSGGPKIISAGKETFQGALWAIHAIVIVYDIPYIFSLSSST